MNSVPLPTKAPNANLGPTAKAFTGLAVGLEAKNALDAYSADPNSYKSKQGEAAARAGTAVGGLALFAVSGPVGWIGVPIAMAANYAIGFTSASSHYNLDELFNPTMETKRHMIGVGNGRFHKELANADGRIDWGNMDTLNKYSVLLTKHIHKLEEDMKANDSYIPDGMRAFTTAGMNAVTEQESRKSDLKIAQAAHKELQGQMNALLVFRQYEGEALLAYSKLTNGVNRELTLLDLDRDHNGVLSEDDKKKMRELMANDKVADNLFASLAQQQITFDNQPISQIQTQASQEQQPQPQQSLTPQPATPTQPQSHENQTPSSSTSGGIFAWIGNLLSGVVNAISSLFTSKEPYVQNITSVQPATNFPRSGGEDPYANVVPPYGPAAEPQANLGRK